MSLASLKRCYTNWRLDIYRSMTITIKTHHKNVPNNKELIIRFNLSTMAERWMNSTSLLQSSSAATIQKYVVDLRSCFYCTSCEPISFSWSQVLHLNCSGTRRKTLRKFLADQNQKLRKLLERVMSLCNGAL